MNALTDDTARLGARNLALHQQQVTILAPVEIAPGDWRIQRAAAWRLPADHPDRTVWDWMAHRGHISPQQAQNMSALANLALAAGATRSSVARYSPLKGRAVSSADDYGPEDEWRALLRDLPGVAYEAISDMLLHNIHPGPHLHVVCQCLDRLDYLPERWAADLWEGEDGP
ncbi:hypothetical protein [Rhodovarius lipocyclicus]|uniref:hypothetical protein n=1 Tax=Rhodovarius lipocyclicus TaxID=268410 RepID=UPI00135C13AE|nr:hypothetical protein [Rhodovarius lipocyclicus]